MAQKFLLMLLLAVATRNTVAAPFIVLPAPPFSDDLFGTQGFIKGEVRQDGIYESDEKLKEEQYLAFISNVGLRLYGERLLVTGFIGWLQDADSPNTGRTIRPRIGLGLTMIRGNWGTLAPFALISPPFDGNDLTASAGIKFQPAVIRAPTSIGVISAAVFTSGLIETIWDREQIEVAGRDEETSEKTEPAYFTKAVLNLRFNPIKLDRIFINLTFEYNGQYNPTYKAGEGRGIEVIYQQSSTTEIKSSLNLVLWKQLSLFYEHVHVTEGFLKWAIDGRRTSDRVGLRLLLL